MTDKIVKQKIGQRTTKGNLSSRIASLRKRLGMKQTPFAELIGTKQNVVSEWENGLYDPSPASLILLGKHDPDDPLWWYERAGPKFAARQRSFLLTSSLARDSVEIKVYSSAGAGAFRSVEETPQSVISFPRGLLASTREIVGLRVHGESMSPLIPDGSIVIVDQTRRTAEAARDHIVAAAEDGGVAIRWLVRSGDLYWLHPNNPEHRPVAVEPSTRLIGVVIKWIAEPPQRK